MESILKLAIPTNALPVESYVPESRLKTNILFGMCFHIRMKDCLFV